MICKTKVYPLGRFVIRQQPHFDNPAFAQFLVFLGTTLIGKQFSAPSISDCERIERERAQATPSRAYAKTTYRVRRLDLAECAECGADFVKSPSKPHTLCQPCRERRKVEVA